MATRPAKRQRRSTRIVSDNEDDKADSSIVSRQSQNATAKLNTTKSTSSTSRLAQRANKSSALSVKTSSTTSSPSASPQKTRKNSKLNLEAQNNKSLHNFFSKATEEQRWQKRASTPQQESQEDLIVDDDIVDDDSAEGDSAGMSDKPAPLPIKTTTLRSFDGGNTSGSRSATPSFSQRFAKLAAPTASQDSSITGTEQETAVAEIKPWADRFRPANTEELAVHKKKIADVQKWLEDVSSGRSPQRILVLKGPAGSGKSTTIELLAQALGMELLSWRNPSVSDAGLASSIQQFAEFLDRGGQFETLSFSDSSPGIKQMSHPERQLLVVEEFPTTMTRSSNVLEAFRSVLLQHILRTTKALQLVSKSASSKYQPVVLIISETLLTSSTALSDSFTAHRLLGPELSHHPLITTIEFNPVAPTFISKAIDLVIRKEARESKRRRMPGPALLQQLLEVGDIRSAINSLEFLCARGDNAADWSGTVATRSKKTPKTSLSLTENEKNALQLISQRESTLDMFHAAGKIVYNKREDPRVLDSRAEPPPKPPDHLMYLYSPKVSQVNVDALLNETGTDIQTFISTLHENYTLSCNGDDFVDAFEGCSHALSDSDFLNPESRSLIRAKGSSRPYTSFLQPGNFDMLRQDEISFQVAARGLLFSLPFPVNRAVPIGARKQDAFKMFYPASLRLWKPAEEVNDLITLFANKGIDENISMAMAGRHDTGVTSWKLRNLAFGSSLSSDDISNESSIRERSFLSRNDLVTELLPYLTFVHDARGKDVQVLKKITQLRGINITGDELLDEEQYERNAKLPATTTRLQQRVEQAHSILQAQRHHAAQAQFGKGAKQVAGTVGNEPVVVVDQEKMYISDDDIQDD